MPYNGCLRVTEAYSRGSREKGEITQKHTLESLGSMHCRTQGVDKSQSRPTSWPSKWRITFETCATVHCHRPISRSCHTSHVCRHDRAQVGQSDIGEDACIRGNLCSRSSRLRQLEQGLGTRSAPLRPCRNPTGMVDVAVCHRPRSE